MKNILYLLTLTIFSTGCYQYSEPTYPTLDGTYILRSITINSTNMLNSEISDETHDDPMTVVYPNPIGPLDTMKVNKTRISISGNHVQYNTPFFNTYRHYLIIEDGLEYMVLECPKQYEDGVYGNEYSYSLTFYREGA